MTDFNELLKSIQSDYIVAIKKNYPVHRFFSVYTLLISFYIYIVLDNNTFINGLSEIKISFLFDFLSVFVLLIATLTMFLIVKMHRYLYSSFFDLFILSDRYQEMVTELHTKFKDADLSKIKSDIFQENELIERKINKLQGWSELLFTIFLSTLMGTILIIYKSFYLQQSLTIFFDWPSALLLSTLAIMIFKLQQKSFLIYIGEFMPYFIAKCVLEEKEPSLFKKDKTPHV